MSRTLKMRLTMEQVKQVSGAFQNSLKRLSARNPDRIIAFRLKVWVRPAVKERAE